ELALVIKQSQEEQKGSDVSVITRANQGYEEQLLAALDQLSDQEVAVELTDMLEEEEVEFSLSPVIKQRKEEQKGIDVSVIIRANQGYEEQLLAALDQISDQEVDVLLTDMLAEEEVAFSLSPVIKQSQEEQKGSDVSVITRANQGYEEQLLATLDQLSDQEVA